MNDVTSIYLVRDMHKNCNDILMHESKKNHTALCILQKRKEKKDLFLVSP